MKYALKEIAFEKKKYILIELLLILLMFMVLFLSGLASGLGRDVSSAIDTMDADSFIVDESAEKLMTVSAVKTTVLDKLREDGVKAAPLNIHKANISRLSDDEKFGVNYFAIEPGSFVEPEVIEGKSLSDSDAQNPILLDDNFREDGISIGDRIVDRSADFEFTVVGFVKDRMYCHTGVGYIATESYTELCRSLNPAYEAEYNAVAVKGGGKTDPGEDGLEVVSKEDIISKIPAYSAEQLTINMILWVLVIVSAVIIGIFNYIITLHKRRQFGVMKAIGLSSAELAGMIISEVCIVSVFAAGISLALTFGMAAGMPEKMPFYLEVSKALIVTAAFVVISIMSSLISVVNISHIDPIIAIGGGDNE